MWYFGSVNLGQQYFELSLLGRELFLETVVHATLVRQNRFRVARGSTAFPGPQAPRPPSYSDSFRPTWVDHSFGKCEFFPLQTNASTPFVDLVTIGRTNRNDLHLRDFTISRTQAFFRCRDSVWHVCDAGSKNGTYVNGKALKPQTEAALKNGSLVQFGSIPMQFFTATGLYDILAGG